MLYLGEYTRYYIVDRVCYVGRFAVTGNIGAQGSGESPSPRSPHSEAEVRQIIVDIEWVLEFDDQGNFTADALSIFISQLNIVIDWLRSPTFARGNKKVILEKLRQARTGLYNAKDNKGKSSFYNHIEKARNALEEALNAWQLISQ